MAFNSQEIASFPLIESPRARKLCRLVGCACLIAFAIDFIGIVFPPNFGAANWRLGTLQQLGDRSIVILFGLALLMYGVERRKLIRSTSLLCLTIGIPFLLSCGVVAQDSLIVQQQAVDQISTQASQLNSRIQAIQTDPNAKVTPERIEQATQKLTTQTETAKRTANSSIFKNCFLSIGNLAVVGISLVILGRYGFHLLREY